MIINNVYINPDNVFSVELIERPANFIRCLINSEMECILTQKGTIRGVDNEFDVINETYELMKEDIISSLRSLNTNKTFTNFEYKLEDGDLKDYGVLKYIFNEFANISNDSHNIRSSSEVEGVVHQHFRKAINTIKQKYRLEYINLQPVEYYLRISSTNVSIDIGIHNESYNLNNITEFFDKIKNPVNVDDLRNYWYSKFENKIQI